MKVKRYIAPNMQTALRQVAQELGDDAVILSTKKVSAGLEVVAALDYEPTYAKYEVERQLRLQEELEVAKQELLSRGKNERLQIAKQADLSTHSGTLAALNKLKQPNTTNYNAATYDVAPVALPETEVSPQVLANNESLQQMQSELKELKQLLLAQAKAQTQTVSTQVASLPAISWVQSQLQVRCQELGLDSQLSRRLLEHVVTADVSTAWQQVMNWLEKNLPIASNSFIEKGGVVALLGPAGAGKTTTIGKAAAQAVLLHGADSVALVTLDNYRVAAHDQLRTFAKILGVELKIVPAAGSLKTTLQSLKNKKLVLIDTAGLSAQDPSFSTQLAKLRQTGHAVKRLLVLPLTSEQRNLQANYQQFKLAGLQGCIFTKLDECFSLGAALSIAIRGKLPISLIANGPHIPQDIQQPNAKKLVKLAQRMTNNAYTEWHKEQQLQNTALRS